MSKRNILKKVIFFITIGISMVSGPAVIKVGEGDDAIIGDGVENVLKGELKAPENLYFNGYTNTLSWNNVENATSYRCNVELNGRFLKQYVVKTPSLNISDLNLTKLNGDKIKFTVYASADDFTSSSANAEFNIFTSDANANFMVADELNKIVNVENITSIDILNFEQSKASGIINFTQNGSQFVKILTSDDENFVETLSHRDFLNNIKLLNDTTNKEETIGEIIDYDSSKLLKYDINKNEEIISFFKQDDEKYPFGFCTKREYEDKFVYKVYPIGLLIPLEALKGDTIQEKLDDLMTVGGCQLMYTVEKSKAIVFEDNKTKENKYLEELKNHIYEYNTEKANNVSLNSIQFDNNKYLLKNKNQKNDFDFN